jgi:hypothetical protein
VGAVHFQSQFEEITESFYHLNFSQLIRRRGVSDVSEVTTICA